MEQYQHELKKIKMILEEHPEGLSVGEISRRIQVNRNSVAKYLDVLNISGFADLRRVGPTKLFIPASRVPSNALLDFADEMIIMCDDKLHIKKMNKAAQKFFSEESLGKNIADVIPFIPQKKSFESHIKKRIVMFKSIQTTFEDGGKGTTFIGEDVTNERKVQERLTLLERAVESTHSGITIADATKKDCPLIYVNSGFEKMTGYKASEILGKNCRFLQREDTNQKCLEKLKKAMEKGDECVVEIRNYKKNGDMFWNELRVSPVKNKSGEITHYIGVQMDITHRK